jgi:hypothetical protein
MKDPIKNTTNTIKLLATLHKGMIDSDGEATISLKIPQSDRVSALTLMTLNDVILEVQITPQANNIYQLD